MTRHAHLHDYHLNMPDMIFYDGHCGLCHRSVTFLLKRDRDGSLFQFSPLQGEAIARSLSADERAQLPDSLVVRTEEGQLLVRSAGTAYMLRRLGGFWGGVGIVLGWVPRTIRDFGYIVVAKCRRRLFGRPPDVCPMVPEEQRRRFIA